VAKLSDSASAEVVAPLAAVWAIVQDVTAWPSWQAGLGGLDVLERDGQGRAALCAIELDAKVTKIGMRLAYSYAAPATMTFERVSGDLSSLSGAWKLDDLGAGRTRATYRLDVDPGRDLDFLLNAERIARLREALVDVRPGELKARAEGRRE
jgi:ribosome-associated toxin RatA of RatAB toxin-antitoxin module